jgi:hypothetical protein
MFAMAAAAGGSIFVSRPTASSGTITSAASAYDLPSSRPDDPPYTTSADVALVTGSAVAGTPDYATVEYNTFTARSKTNFSQCQLVIGLSNALNSVAINSYNTTPPGTYTTDYVRAGLSVDYQVDGTNWVTIKSYGQAANSVNTGEPDSYVAPGFVLAETTTKETLSVTIPSSSFPSNLSSLKVRFVLGTCKNNVVTSYQSSGSYQVWDIRANIS